MNDSADESTPRKKGRPSGVRNLNKSDSFMNADVDFEIGPLLLPSPEEMEIDGSPQQVPVPVPKSPQKVASPIKKSLELRRLEADHQHKFFEGVKCLSESVPVQDESSRARVTQPVEVIEIDGSPLQVSVPSSKPKSPQKVATATPIKGATTPIKKSLELRKLEADHQHKFFKGVKCLSESEESSSKSRDAKPAEVIEIDGSPPQVLKPPPKSPQKVATTPIKKSLELRRLEADRQFKFFEGVVKLSSVQEESSSRVTRRLSIHLGQALNAKYLDQAQIDAYNNKKSISKSRRTKRSFSKGKGTPTPKHTDTEGKKRVSRSKKLKLSTGSDESPVEESETRLKRKSLVKNRGKENLNKLSKSYERTTDDSSEEPAEDSIIRPSRIGGGNRGKGRGKKVDLVSSSGAETPEGSGSNGNSSSSSSHGSSSSEEEEYDSDESVVLESSNCQTPKRSLRKMDGIASMTPTQLSLLKQSTPATPKSVRTPLQVDVSEIPRTPNSASYFSASKRILFRKVTNKAKDKKVNESKKNPKKAWHKFKQTENDKRPDDFDRKISITRETARIMQNYEGQFYHNNHVEESNNLQQQVQNQFPKWVFLMREGFNVLLYGYGSKLPILTGLHSYLKDEFTIMTVNGLMLNDSRVSAKKFVSDFYNSLPEFKNLPKLSFTETNVTRNADVLYNFLKDKNLDDVFVLIANFDELAFAQPNFVNCLSSLARLKSFHIVASSDHINAFMGVNFNQLANFNFQWFDATTFIPYDIELTYKPQVFGEKDLLNSAKNIFEHVLKSLTQNSKKAFKLLAQLQLDQLRNVSQTQTTKLSTKNTEMFVESKTPTKIKISSSKNKAAKGILYRDLLRRCRESFIAHSDNALKSLLQEFFDHKLIHYEDKTKSDEKRITIDLDIEILEEFISSN